MQFPSLPADADDNTRLAYAGWALSMVTFQAARSGGNISQEGWRALVAPIKERYAQGDSAASQWIKEGLEVPE